MQGQGNKPGEIMVAHFHKWMPPGLGFVMMSRTSLIEELYITGEFDVSKIKCSQEAKKENQRLEDMCLHQKFLDYNQLRKPFLVYSLNVRSLRKHFEDVQGDSILLQGKVIFLAETWLHDSDCDKYQLGGFKSVFANNGHGKGIALYYKGEGKVIEVVSKNSYQFIALEMQDHKLIGVYASSNCKYHDLADDLCELNLLSMPTVILGDLNFDASSQNILASAMQRKEFKQVIDRATQVKGRIIDHIYLSPDLQETAKTSLEYVYYSDHEAIGVDLTQDALVDDKLEEEDYEENDPDVEGDLTEEFEEENHEHEL